MPSPPPTIDEVVGRRILKLRTEEGWSQDEVARRMRENGFKDWTRSVVAAIENGGRRVGLGELVGLSIVFWEPLAALVGPASGPWIH